MIYWVRFEWKFAVAAIIANLHECIILGFFVLQWSSAAVLAAVCGLGIGYESVDLRRIRENSAGPKMTTTQIIANAITSPSAGRSYPRSPIVCVDVLFGARAALFARALTSLSFRHLLSVFVARPARVAGRQRDDREAAPARRSPHDPNAARRPR